MTFAHALLALLGGLYAFTAVYNVRRIGKPPRPVTPQIAAGGLVISFMMIAAVAYIGFQL